MVSLSPSNVVDCLCQHFCVIQLWFESLLDVSSECIDRLLELVELYLGFLFLDELLQWLALWEVLNPRLEKFVQLLLLVEGILVDTKLILVFQVLHECSVELYSFIRVSCKLVEQEIVCLDQNLVLLEGATIHHWIIFKALELIFDEPDWSMRCWPVPESRLGWWLLVTLLLQRCVLL